MTTRNQETRRESRSVRLSPREWAAAEAIAKLSRGAAWSAGAGLREALQAAEDALNERGKGTEFDTMVEEIMNRNAMAGGQ